MHKNFGEWYRLVSIEPMDEVLRKRWAGVEQWTSTMSGDDDALFETVRIFRGLPQKTSRDEFSEAFREHDAAFPLRNNDLEQRVLAGASLVQCLLAGKGSSEDESETLRAALLIGASVEASDLYDPEGNLRELMNEMLFGFNEITKRLRNRSDLNPVLIQPKERAELDKTFKDMAADQDPAQFKVRVEALLGTLFKALRRSEEALVDAVHDLRCADEENNILWWLAGKTSKDLNKTWSSLGDATPIVAGSELASLIKFPLDSQNAEALLGQVISEVKGPGGERPLSRYVNVLPESWVKAHSAAIDEKVVDLTPLSFAITLRGRTNNDTWPSIFERDSGLKASSELTSSQVARLAYIEAALFSILSE